MGKSRLVEEDSHYRREWTLLSNQRITWQNVANAEKSFRLIDMQRTKEQANSDEATKETSTHAPFVQTSDAQYKNFPN